LSLGYTVGASRKKCKREEKIVKRSEGVEAMRGNGQRR
jgi:hypothetical protein